MPILDQNSIEAISHSAGQTRRIGMRLGGILQAGDVICLSGDLGSGKTTLVHGIASGWGSLDPATSPTFVLVNVYRRPDSQCLYHLDAYRLSGAREAEDLDIYAYIENGPVVIEWAERIKSALPAQCLWIRFHMIDINQRDMVISAYGDRFQNMLSNMRRELFGIQ